jgi:hypothetical protein
MLLCLGCIYLTLDATLCYLTLRIYICIFISDTSVVKGLKNVIKISFASIDTVHYAMRVD